MSLFGSKPSNDSPERRARLEALCATVKSGLAHVLAVGDALAEIRDQQLYLLESPTFEAFCRDRWDMTAQHAGRLMMAASVARELEPIGFPIASERQIRPLASLAPADRIEAWKEATLEADENGRVPSIAVEKAAAKRSPKKAAKTRKRLKPVRFRVPGARIEITPNAKFVGVEQSLRWALDQAAKAGTSKAA